MWVCESTGPAVVKPMVVGVLVGRAFEPPPSPEEAGGPFSLVVELVLLPLLPLGRSEEALERAELVGAAALGGVPVDPGFGTEPEQRPQRGVGLRPAR